MKMLNEKKWKKGIACLLAATTMGSLVACGSSSSTTDGDTTEAQGGSATEETAKTEDGVTTIKYTFRYDSDNITEEEADASRNGMIKNGFTALEEELGGTVKFEIEYLPKLEIDELAMQASGGVEADMFLDEESALGQAVKGGLVQPVDWFIELDNVKGSYYENIVNVSMYQGHLYGIPVDIAPNMLYANKNMLKEIGWTDEDIAAWPEKVKNGEWIMQDLIDTAKQAMDAGVAKYGFMLDGVDNSSSFSIANTFGFDIADVQENKLVVTDEWIDVFTLWNQLVNVDKVTPESLTNFEGTYETFYQNESLFFTDVSGFNYWQRNSGMTTEEFQAHYEENYTQALLPAINAGESGSTGMKVRSLFISPLVEGEKLEYLKQAINLAYEPENTTIPMLEMGKPGVLRTAAELPVIQEFKFLSDIAYMADYCGIRPAHPDFNSKYHKYYRTQVEAIIVDKITPEEAWEKMKQEIEFNIDAEELLYK